MPRHSADTAASVLLTGARVHGHPQPVDVLLEGGQIAGIGAIDAEQAQPAEIIDIAGRWLIPGLWDHHVHFTQWSLGAQRLDISSAFSASETAQLVGAALLAMPQPLDPDLPLLGIGFRDGLWPDAPTVELLDAAADAHPVVLVSADLHAVWLNTAALNKYGHEGHPTGLLREDEAFEITRRIGTVPDEIVDGWVLDAAAQAAARGVVGIVDLEMSWNLDVWRRRIDAGFSDLRVEFGIYTEHLDRAIDQGLHTGQQFGELLSVAGYKVLTDGSLNTRTAYCFEEYPGLEGLENSRGMLTVSGDELHSLMAKAVAAGIMPIVHAIGDHANRLALDAFEELGCAGRIEHAQLLDAADVARFAALNVEASVQPDHAMDDRDVAEKHWHGRTDRAFALRSLVDAGATLRLGSDAPVSALDPWVTMAAAVFRARDGRDSWHPEQAISAEQALAASVRTSVSVGERADLVIVDIDPLQAGLDELTRMPVAGTLLGGRFTYREGV